MAFKDNFRIEKIYFQRVKDDAQILGSWKNDPRRYSREEIVRVAKDACDSVLMLYRLLGECWNDALNQIEKLSAELESLAGKTEAYHDELNEKIDDVNNYLMALIRELQERVDALENRVDILETEINIVLDLVEDTEQPTRGKKNREANTTYHLEYHGETVDYDAISELIEGGADRIIWVRAFLSLLHFVPSETNTIVFTRSFYSKDDNKLKKEKVTINSSDVVTYVVDEKVLNTLPDPTIENLDKGLFIEIGDYIQGANIVPLQTISGSSGTIQNAAREFTDGEHVFVYLDNVLYETTYTTNNGIYFDFGEGDYLSLYYDGDDLTYETNLAQTHTLSVFGSIPVAEWKINYPKIFYVDFVPDPNDTTKVIANKTFEEISNAYLNNALIIGRYQSSLLRLQTMTVSFEDCRFSCVDTYVNTNTTPKSAVLTIVEISYGSSEWLIKTLNVDVTGRD